MYLEKKQKKPIYNIYIPIKNREAFAWQICDLLIHSKRYGITVKNPNLRESFFYRYTDKPHRLFVMKIKTTRETKD